MVEPFEFQKKINLMCLENNWQMVSCEVREERLMTRFKLVAEITAPGLNERVYPISIVCESATDRKDSTDWEISFIKLNTRIFVSVLDTFWNILILSLDKVFTPVAIDHMMMLFSKDSNLSVEGDHLKNTISAAVKRADRLWETVADCRKVAEEHGAKSIE